MKTHPANGKVSQTDDIRDHVLPLCVVEDGELKGLLGTAFLIGDNSHALTAGHCIPSDTNGLSCLFVVDGEWTGVPVVEVERHATEDVAILRLAADGLRSFLYISKDWHGSGARYRSFGYPDDTYNEIVIDGQIQIRPDLVYTEGHIRRRISREVPGFRGSGFFELSTVAGGGASGSPLFVRELTLLDFYRPHKPDERWPVIGIYLGDRSTTLPVPQGDPPRQLILGHGLRSEAFADWQPIMIGHPYSMRADSQFRVRVLVEGWKRNLSCPSNPVGTGVCQRSE